MNLYNPCVANKMVNVYSITVVWHVGHLNVSQKDQFDIKKLAVYFSNIFGNYLTVHRGKVHNYLDMDL